jgi:hypothetical protein
LKVETKVTAENFPLGIRYYSNAKNSCFTAPVKLMMGLKTQIHVLSL